MRHHTEKYRHDRNAFRTIKNKHRMTVFYPMTEFPPTREQIRACVTECLHHGISCVIPELPAGLTPGRELMDGIRAMYADFARVIASERCSLQVGILLDPRLEESYFLSLDPGEAAPITAQSITRHTYFCDPGEKVHIRLQNTPLASTIPMSIPTFCAW